jgi:succinate dehydrogenase/fumarate reductase-like Fe-S protein
MVKILVYHYRCRKCGYRGININKRNCLKCGGRTENEGKYIELEDLLIYILEELARLDSKIRK